MARSNFKAVEYETTFQYPAANAVRNNLAWTFERPNPFFPVFDIQTQGVAGVPNGTNVFTDTARYEWAAFDFTRHDNTADNLEAKIDWTRSVTAIRPVNGRRLDSLAGGRKPEIVMFRGMPIGISNPAAVRMFKANPEKFLSGIEEAMRVTGIVQNRPTPVPADCDLVALAERRFHQALSRPPNDHERRILRGVFGAVPTRADLADATWLALMKPEFQLLQ